MRKIWVLLLTALAFGLGLFASKAYMGLTGSIKSIRIACELLNTAESWGILTRPQRADVVDHLLERLPEIPPDMLTFIEELKTGCPNLPRL
jgi:hypothetical protein